jgi:deferrochelatase/peroxidase EfeB
MNPRDADVAGMVRIHRMIRRGTSYGPILPEGVMDDDGADRRIDVCLCRRQLGRQFEFVQSEWMNGSVFFGGKSEKDPIAGAADSTGTFDVPRRPI